MTAYDNPLTNLTAQARGGDPAALVGLRAALEPRIARVVQQVLRVGPGPSVLDRRIARELALSERAHPGGPRDRQTLATQVTRRVCAAVLDGLRSNPRGAAVLDGLRSNPRGTDGLKDTVREL
jgi:hypothetical protein